MKTKQEINELSYAHYPHADKDGKFIQKNIAKRGAFRRAYSLAQKEKKSWDTFEFACQLLEDLGYTKTSTHPYNIADCLRGKMGLLPKNKIRKSK